MILKMTRETSLTELMGCTDLIGLKAALIVLVKENGFLPRRTDNMESL